MDTPIASQSAHALKKRKAVTWKVPATQYCPALSLHLGTMVPERMWVQLNVLFDGMLPTGMSLQSFFKAICNKKALQPFEDLSTMSMCFSGTGFCFSRCRRPYVRSCRERQIMNAFKFIHNGTKTQ
jgi:hypothetical protein